MFNINTYQYWNRIKGTHLVLCRFLLCCCFGRGGRFRFSMLWSVNVWVSPRFGCRLLASHWTHLHWLNTSATACTASVNSHMPFRKLTWSIVNNWQRWIFVRNLIVQSTPTMRVESEGVYVDFRAKTAIFICQFLSLSSLEYLFLLNYVHWIIFIFTQLGQRDA